MRKRFAIIPILLFAFGCNELREPKVKEEVLAKSKQTDIRYARTFTILEHASHKEIQVLNPADTSELLYRYILINKERDKPVSYNTDKAIVVRTPVESVICLSNTHLYYLQQLGVADKVVAVSKASHIRNEDVGEKIEAGTIKEVGDISALNVEQVIALEPGMVTTYPFESQGFNKLRELQQPITVLQEHLETSPLGRVEWIKFVAAFFNKEKEAEEYFAGIEERYNALVEKTKTVDKNPTVFSHKPWQGTWYMPGGKSHMANLFKDAGADYLWKETDETGSLQLDFEAVYNKAKKANYWVMVVDRHEIYNRQELKNEHELFGDFDAYKNEHIIYCNLMHRDYFGKGVIETDVVLADLISFFHPGLLPEHKPVYFERLH